MAKMWFDAEEEPVREYDYTRRAVKQMNLCLDSKMFEQMDAEAIFRMLSDKIEIVTFRDYLKRYLYIKAEIDAPFRTVSDEIYLDIMVTAFRENHAPLSLTDKNRKLRPTLRAWLNQDSVRRQTVFVLGFGLRMTAADVSAFLLKALKEEELSIDDPQEIIFRYCYLNELNFGKAGSLLQTYEELTPCPMEEKKWQEMREAPDFYLRTEKNLISYLAALKASHIDTERKQYLIEEYRRLYDRCRDIIADIQNEEEKFSGKGRVTREDIQPADVEKIFCCGIPRDSKGKPRNMSGSLLGRHFEQKRMSRQRIFRMLEGSQLPERFDLLSLLFFIFAETVEKDWPAERSIRFTDEANAMLARCRLRGLYAANPYEIFLLMCLVTDEPLTTYSDIWERSYSGEMIKDNS